MTEVKVQDLLGKTLSSVDVGKDEITFTLDDGKQYKMLHVQDCCESVEVEDVIGDINDLVGAPLLMAEEVESNENPEGVTKEYQDSLTWTFYKFATIKGYVTIRWYGESNGYYSESVDFVSV
jgi:hypothetical protein